MVRTPTTLPSPETARSPFTSIATDGSSLLIPTTPLYPAEIMESPLCTTLNAPVVLIPVPAFKRTLISPSSLF